MSRPSWLSYLDMSSQSLSHSLSGREKWFLSGVPALTDCWCFLEHRVDRGSETSGGSVLWCIGHVCLGCGRRRASLVPWRFTLSMGLAALCSCCKETAARRRVSELASDLATCSPTCPTSAGLVSSVCACSVASRVLFFVTHWTIALQAPLSMGSSRQEYWSGLPALLQGIFLAQWANLCLLYLLHWQVCSLTVVPPGKALLFSGCLQLSWPKRSASPKLCWTSLVPRFL